MFEIRDDCGAVTEHADARPVENIATLFSHSGFKLEHSVIDIRDRRGESRTGASSD